MKILIVDDHAMVRQAIAALIERGSPDTVVVQAADSAGGLALAAEHRDLDAVFLDLSMPGMDGLDALETFGARHPGLPVIVLSASDDPQVARKAFALGALGYVPKAASSETLLTALTLVLRGEVFVPSLVLRAVSPPVPPVTSTALTQRQIEVLQHLGEGLSNKLIARRMGLSEKTVKGHVTGLFRALSVGDRNHAIAAARQNGLI